jgi:hypothetical protein
VGLQCRSICSKCQAFPFQETSSDFMV